MQPSFESGMASAGAESGSVSQLNQDLAQYQQRRTQILAELNGSRQGDPDLVRELMDLRMALHSSVQGMREELGDGISAQDSRQLSHIESQLEKFAAIDSSLLN